MKYKLAKGQRKQPLVGHRFEDRDGTTIRHNIPVVFEVDEEVDCGDLVMSHWEDMGIIKMVEELREKEGDSQVGSAGGLEHDNGAEDDHSVDVASDDGPDPCGYDLDGGPVVLDEEGDDTQLEEIARVEGGGYTEEEDGSFTCLYCGKVLKREGSMVRHVETKHA
jgi:hypothetical protein